MDRTPWHQTFRQQLPTCLSYTYLNTGTAGPIPAHSQRAADREGELELNEGRGNFSSWGRFFERLENCRELAARLMGADPDEVALTHHTSEGINIILWGMDWQPGDEVVTTTLEHDAICVPLGLLRERHGVVIKFADVGLGEPQQSVDALRQAITDKTRLVALSHIAYSSGATLPIKAIAKLAHAAGAQILVDGAQSCGVMPLSMRELGVDYYTLSGQKWPLGPEGTGALYLRRESLELVRPTFASYFTPAKHDFRGNVELQAGAKRFETGMVHRPSWAAFESSTRWLLDEVKLERAWGRSLALAEQARQRLSTIGGLTIITPEKAPSPLLSFDLPSFSPAQLFALTLVLAKEQKLVLRSTPHPPYCLRAAFGFYNTEQEVELLAKAMEEALGKGPGQLVIEGYAEKLPQSRDS